MEMTLHSRIREESKANKADVLTVSAFLTRFFRNWQCLSGERVEGEAEIVHNAYYQCHSLFHGLLL